MYTMGLASRSKSELSSKHKRVLKMHKLNLCQSI